MSHGSYAECPQCGVVAHGDAEIEESSDSDIITQSHNLGVNHAEVAHQAMNH